MKKTKYGIACAVINKNGEILLLKRSSDKKLFPGKWFLVGAYPLKENDDFEKKAHLELIDEIGFDGKILKRGKILKLEVDGEVIDIHTYLASRGGISVKLNKEHTEYKWVNPDEVLNYDIVPGTNGIIDGLINGHE